MPEIPGIKASGELLQSFRREVADLLGRSSTGFPGAQPVSFAARHKTELLKQDYYVCEKSDGIRCLMYLTGDGPEEITYLVDRKNDYYHVRSLHFPISSEQELEFHTRTLVDGELVNDTMPNGSTQLKYLVFDCLVLDGSSLMHRTLDKRLAYFRDKVFNPYRALYKKYPEEIQYLPFIVEYKKMEYSYAIEMMFREVLPNLPHGNDGLIFTCRDSPYQFGTDQHILKWKSEDENSIDFRTKIEWAIRDCDFDDPDENGNFTPFPDYWAIPTIHLAVFRTDGKDGVYGAMYLEKHEWEDLKALEEPLNERIVECYLDEQNRWRFLRFRDDKHEANHISTVQSVMESIQDKVSKDDLIGVAKSIRDEWKKRQGLESAKTKQEHDSRKALTAHAATNSPNSATTNGGAGTKRKAGENMNSMSEHNATRRKLSPHDAQKDLSTQEGTSSPNCLPVVRGGGMKRKAEDDEDSQSEHSAIKRKLSQCEEQKESGAQEATTSPTAATRSDGSGTKIEFEDDEDLKSESSPKRIKLSPQSDA